MPLLLPLREPVRNEHSRRLSMRFVGSLELIPSRPLIVRQLGKLRAQPVLPTCWRLPNRLVKSERQPMIRSLRRVGSDDVSRKVVTHHRKADVITRPLNLAAIMRSSRPVGEQRGDRLFCWDGRPLAVIRRTDSLGDYLNA